MKNYAIVVDSTTDLAPSMAAELGVEVIPYIFTLDGKEYYNYLDYRDISVKDFYNTLRAGKTASTTLITAARYMEAWEPHLQQGQDILYMCLSSMLSKSFEQSQLAAREASEKYPDRKIITIDTKAASLGQGALAHYASKAREEGKTIDELKAYIEEMIPRLHLWVMADDLHHLRRGGRVSGAAAFLGTMLNVKPILTIHDDGRLAPQQKVRGRAKALDCFMDRIAEFELNPKEQPIFLAHSDVPEFAEQARAMIAEKFGIKEFVINEIGPVIGAHTGPGTLAVIFLANKPRLVYKG